MGNLGKITITKNKDCDNRTYYSAYIYGIDAVIGGGDTRNEAKDELFGNIVFYVNYLVETNQKLKQQLAEKDIRIEELECQFAYECECNKQLVDLQKQLAEKDKEIKKLNWQLKDKDFIIKNLNHSLSVAPNANAGQRARIDELTKIVKEKDKEIERLKNLFELNNEVVINQGKEIFDLRVQVLQQKQNQTQLAIQELEKVKMMTEWKFNSIVDVVEYIDNQIKELKGE